MMLVYARSFLSCTEMNIKNVLLSDLFIVLAANLIANGSRAREKVR